jgi:hypothetical protein
LHPSEWAAIGHVWKRVSQVMLCRAIKGSFTRKLHPLSTQGQGNHLASAQNACSSGLGFSGSNFDWQTSSIMTYHVVLKVSRSIISEFLWFGLLTVRSGTLLFNPFLFYTKRLSILSPRYISFKFVLSNIHIRRPCEA